MKPIVDMIRANNSKFYLDTNDTNTGYRIQETGNRIQETGYRIQKKLDIPNFKETISKRT